MRRKITDKSDLDTSNLPDLTPKQFAFVKGILDGKTASDAYRAAYDCSNSQDTTIWVKASELRASGNVSVWLAAARKAGLGAARLTLEGHLQELERLKEIAIDTGNVGAAVQAEQLRGKAAGHYTENIRIFDANPLDALKEIAQTAPDLAAQLAKEHGIEWTQETQH